MAHAKGNAVPAVREPIAVRSTKLNHLLLGRGSGQLANRHLASRDSLLDALFALYDECNREQLRRDKNIALFLDKCECVRPRRLVSPVQQSNPSFSLFLEQLELFSTCFGSFAYYMFGEELGVKRISPLG